MAKLEKIAAVLATTKEILSKVSDETTAQNSKIAALVEQVAALKANEVTQEEIDAIYANAQDLATSAQAIDDLTTDAVDEFPDEVEDEPIEDEPIEDEPVEDDTTPTTDSFGNSTI